MDVYTENGDKYDGDKLLHRSRVKTHTDITDDMRRIVGLVPGVCLDWNPTKETYEEKELRVFQTCVEYPTLFSEAEYELSKRIQAAKDRFLAVRDSGANPAIIQAAENELRSLRREMGALPEITGNWKPLK